MTMGAGTFEQVEEAAAFIRARCPRLPETAIVLGSGLGDFAARPQQPLSFAYDALPHWPQAHVVGHAGRLVFGDVSGHQVAVLSGRAHLYEGRPLGEVVFATRVMARLGVRRLVLTNAAGGINTAFAAGALMVIDDHINLLGTNPLVGPNDDRFGPRFPDMTGARSQEMGEAWHDAGQFYWGRREAFRMHHIVYAARCRAVMLPRAQVQDLDTPEDWAVAETRFPFVHV